MSDVQEIHHEEKSVHHELVSDVQLIFLSDVFLVHHSFNPVMVLSYFN